MNILYINHYAGSLQHGMEYRPYYLAREWVKSGHKATIIASNYSHLRQQNVIIPDDQEYRYETIDGINYIWCKTRAYTGNGLNRVLNIFSFLNKVKAIKVNIVRDIKPDLVIASSTYPFDTRVAYQIAKMSKAKFVYEVHDLWPLTPIEVGGMSKWHPFIMAMQWAENFGYKNADKVVSLLPKAKDYMLRHGMQDDKFVYIPNGVVVEDWMRADKKMPEEHQKLITRLRDIDKKFIIGYAGGMGESNALDYLLSAAKKLLAQPIAFVLVGDGTNKPKLLERIKQEQINNVHILPSINKLEIPNFLHSCDGLYIGWHKLPIYRFGICPNKLFDYMLAEKPIIHSVTAGNDLVEEANCGISVEAENIDQIAWAIYNLSQLDKAVLARIARNGYNYVLSYHDYRVLAAKFLSAVDYLVDQV